MSTTEPILRCSREEVDLWRRGMVLIVSNKDSPDCKEATNAWLLLDKLQDKVIERKAEGNVTELEARYAGVVEELWLEASPRWGKAPPQEPQKTLHTVPLELTQVASPEIDPQAEASTCLVQ